MTHYNNWLQTARLGGLLLAADYKEQKVDKNDSARARSSKENVVLVLTPVPSYKDPEKFAAAWNEARGELEARGIDIYSLLLNKLADYAFLQLDAATVEIRTDNADIFSLHIYFDGQLKHEENIILGKGANQGLTFNFGGALASMHESCFNTYRPNQMDAVRHRLELFFKRYKHDPGGIKLDSIVSHDKKELRLRIYHIFGEVTGRNYHELINLDISLENDEICYTVDAAYAAGISKTPDPESDFYREVALDFPQKWLSFRDNLEDQLKAALDGK